MHVMQSPHFFVPTDILLWFPIRTSFIQEENENMKEIFQEYGGILITVVAILAVILVITAVVGTDTSGIHRGVRFRHW